MTVDVPAPVARRLEALEQQLDLQRVRWLLSLPLVVGATALWLPVFERAQHADRLVQTAPGFVQDPDTFTREALISLLGWSHLGLLAVGAVAAAVLMTSQWRSTRVAAHRVVVGASGLSLAAIAALGALVAGLEHDEIHLRGAFSLLVLLPAWLLAAALLVRRDVARPG